MKDIITMGDAGIESTTSVKQSEIEEVNVLENIATPQVTRDQIDYMRAMRKDSRLYKKIWEYTEKNNTTLEHEYQLILEKKSNMSGMMRSYLKAVMEYVPTPEEQAEIDARDQRIKDYESNQAEMRKEEE